MAKKKAAPEQNKHRDDPNVMGLHAQVVEQPISQTLELNYMPYAMSVIVSRAIPEIDGFKPSHRKLLYTMYKMGLLNGARTKSANIVGATMKLNPHGDAAIYETMVRLARGNGALLAPFVDSKGNFGKVYSRDMSYAAPRYTEAKLAPICRELFSDIDEDTVDMVDNYDATMLEPTLLPTTFPNVLVSANTGIAVGMASNICGFNLREVCQTAIAWIRDPDCDLLETLPAPDFSTGGEILYDPLEMAEIYKTGRGSFKVRAKWRYLKKENIIEIYEIPYTTTSEAIMDKVEELIKAGKVREINDMRDETDLSGLKLTIDLKRGADPDKLMAKLCRMTTLMDSYPCNFNILIAGMPQVLGVREILEEWTAWRSECVRRRVFFQLQKKKEKLHLLKGLQKILLDIDKAIAIIRGTELDSEVIPNLMIGFGIDKVQAEFVAEIKLRNINKEYILKRTAETEELENQIQDLEQTLKSSRRIRAIIVDELKKVAQKYGEDRRTTLVYETALAVEEEQDDTPDYPVTVFVTEGGYLKKITAQSLRMSNEQKYKEGDGLKRTMELTNKTELLVFTSACQCYKCRLSDFDDSKASVLGDYLPGKLGFDEGESVLDVVSAGDYSGWILFVFENGKAAKVERSAYATKSNRRKLTGAFSDKSPVKAVIPLPEETEVAVYATDGRALVFSSALLSAKTTRNTQGVAVMSLKRKSLVDRAAPLAETGIVNRRRYSVRSLPAPGSLLQEQDTEEKQLAIEG
ncbi:MAG: topoisomerase IV [Ruminococcaceae bacterium]|jgi:DNA gyrase subunit A|nr:topoisomerase IV [Oscillospiraceae bacterium]